MKHNKRIIQFTALGFGALVVIAWFSFKHLPDIKRWLRNVDIVQLSSANLAVKDVGEGGPTIVLVNGVGVQMSAYWKLQDALSPHTRVVAYDRPGVGYSPENGAQKTLDNMDRDLHELLQVLDVPQPYILVGHSFGGHVIRYYASKHPTEIAGLVFLDAPHEGWLDYIRENWSAELLDPYFSFWRGENPNIIGGSREEILAYEDNSNLVRGNTISADIPVLMFTGNNAGHFRKDDQGYLTDRKAWAESQASMIEGVVDAEHIIDWDAGHWIQNDKPEMVIHKILMFLNNIRSKTEH